MEKHFLQVHAFRGVDDETFTDETFGEGVDFNVVGERKLAEFNFLVGVFDLG